MRPFDEEWSCRVRSLEEQGLRRGLREVASPQGVRIVIEGKEALNFSSNDYLGLANHPRLKVAAIGALEKFGAGAGASRLICGSLEVHHELESALAAFKKTEAALVFSSGYATALGTIPALVSAGDVVVLDKLVHASIVDAARLSRAKLRVFAHNDLNDLEAILKWAARKKAGRILVITESLFSMDGDFAPLPEIVALKDQYGAWLMVDEAHATGLFGETRGGWIEQCGVGGAVEVQMGTLGKAIGSAGGFIAGSRALVDFLVNRARSFIFSTAPPASISAAAIAGIATIRSPEGAERLARLRAHLQTFQEAPRVKRAAENSPIQPLLIGGESAAVRFARVLWDAGIFVPAIRYPSVARGQARLRITFSAAHAPGDVEKLREAIRSIQVQEGLLPAGN